MANVPTFFFSHTRQDREMRGNYIDKFFEDLEGKLAQLAAVDRARETVGTIDRKVLQGADWDKFLSEPLSRNKAFVLVMTPTYFTRENCGKEFYSFVLRSPTAGIDSNAALTGEANVVPIRWLPQQAYHTNTATDSVIPPILRLLNDRPADGGG